MGITILLATYNGERYLSEQLDSILSQSMLPKKIYISDDCSTDNTWKIIESYQREYPNLIIATQNKKNSGGAKYNFIDMMIQSQEGYNMLCDQDDIWLPEKIEQTFAEMKSMERQYSEDTPILVHTDLKVVDENLNIINPSVKELVGTAQIESLKDIILQNHVTGCTAMYNSALAAYIQEVPPSFVMHDWWLAMVAVTFAKISYIPISTSLYRQHDSNVVGTQNVKSLSHKLYKICNTREIRDALFTYYDQASSFLEIYRDTLAPNQIQLLTIFSQLPQQNKCQRLQTMWRHDLFRQGFLRKLSQIAFG